MSGVFFKFSNNRAPQYSIYTTICEESGTRWVEKHPDTKRSILHVQKMQQSYAQLKKQYNGTRLFPCNCTLSGNVVHFPYVYGVPLNNRFISLLDTNNSDNLSAFIKEYVDLIIAGEKVPFVKSKEFIDLFGDICLPDGLYSMRCTNIDMIFDNLIVLDDNSICLIDYEWCFNFPIPINYVIYRSLFISFEKVHKTEVLDSKILSTIGIGEQEIALYKCMEQKFRNMVYADAYPIDEYYYALGKNLFYPIEEHEELLKTRDGLQKAQFELNKAQFELNEIKESKSWKLITYLRRGRALLSKMNPFKSV